MWSSWPTLGYVSQIQDPGTKYVASWVNWENFNFQWGKLAARMTATWFVRTVGRVPGRRGARRFACVSRASQVRTAAAMSTNVWPIRAPTGPHATTESGTTSASVQEGDTVRNTQITGYRGRRGVGNWDYMGCWGCSGYVGWMCMCMWCWRNEGWEVQSTSISPSVWVLWDEGVPYIISNRDPNDCKLCSKL